MLQSLKNKQKLSSADNFYNAYEYQQHWYSWKDTHVYCHDNTLKPDDCNNDPGHIVVENDHRGDGLALAFCDRWFELKKYKDAFDQASKDDTKMYDVSQYDNRARAWITAMMLVKTIGTYPQINGKTVMKHQAIEYPGSPRGVRYYVNEASQAKFLSKHSQDRTKFIKTLSNADNYAWYAMATLVQGRIGEYPWRPLSPKDLPPLSSLKRAPEGEEKDLQAASEVHGFDKFDA